VVGPAQSYYDRDQWRENRGNSDAPAGACYIHDDDDDDDAVCSALFKLQLKISSFCTAQCTIVQNAVLRLHVVCPSVRLSVRDADES